MSRSWLLCFAHGEEMQKEVASSKEEEEVSSSSHDECVDEDNNDNDGSEYEESDESKSDREKANSNEEGEDIYIDLDADVESEPNNEPDVADAVVADAVVVAVQFPAGRRSARNAAPPCRFGIDDFNGRANNK